MIFWDRREDRLVERILDGLIRSGTRVHLASDILPDFHSKPALYELHPYDRHPNKVAHELIADFVVRQVLQDPRQP